MATFRTIMTFRSKANNHRSNIRFTAGAEEVKSLNEKRNIRFVLICRRVKSPSNLRKNYGLQRESRELKATAR